MTRQNVIILGGALFLGLIAVFLANAFFSGMEDRTEAVVKQARLTRIAVAAQPIEYGEPLNNSNVKMVDWPEASLPAGSFARFEDAVNNRVALRPIVPGEPILSDRVSGTDGRATLAANLPADKVAVSIPISDVAGVAGFVRPGDAVDVMLTKIIPGDGARPDDKMTDIVMQAVPVLAIDQVADSKSTEAAVAKTATLQVDSFGAQQLALARELGTLSLALRNAGSPALGNNRTVTKRDLTASNLYIRQRQTGSSAAPATATAPAAQPARQVAMAPAPSSQPAQPRYYGPTMTVFRQGKPTQYEVNRGN